MKRRKNTIQPGHVGAYSKKIK